MIAESKIKKRNPILAGIITFGAFGLGQLYNGQTKKAALGYALWIVIAVFTIMAPLSSSIVWLMASQALLYLIGLALIIDAFRSARKLKDIALRPYNRWYLYLAIIMLQLVIVLPFQVNLMTRSLRAFRIPTQGMSPTLEIGDGLVADMRAYERNTPKRGDVIIFKYPNNESMPYVKRVIGLPGERLEMTGRVVYINHKPLIEHSAQYIDPNSTNEHWGPYEIPQDSYFVLGDNRDNSQDSRFWGFVSRRQLLGQARYLYWAKNWKRIGAKLE